MPHSPEPWLEGISGAIVIVPTDSQKEKFPQLISKTGGYPIAYDMHERDRDRAIRCVNACADLPTEALTPKAFKGVIKLIREMIREFEKDVQKQTFREKEYIAICKEVLLKFKVDQQ